jgi:hypothetical protein
MKRALGGGLFPEAGKKQDSGSDYVHTSKSLLMKNVFLLLILFSLSAIGITAQTLVRWDAGGDGTSWNDPNNWDNNMVPAAGDSVQVNMMTTLTGTAPDNPSRLEILASANVTLDLDLTIDDAVKASNALKIQHSATFTVASGRTLTIHTAANLEGIQHNANSTNPSTIVIENSAALNITQARDGISISNDAHTLINNGSIMITGVNRDGISNVTGEIINNGTITITTPVDDCIELTGGTFTNHGLVDVTVPDGAGSAINGLSIGTATAPATFINAVDGTVMADAGSGTNARAIFNYPSGTLSNAGSIIVSNGNAGATIFTQGNFNNELGGRINLTIGRINVNLDTLFNNGLIETDATGSGVYTTSVFVNNAFYDYLNASAAGITGGSGEVINNGINLNSGAQTTINAMSNCFADIAEAPYTWYESGNLVGTADATGLLTFGMDVLSSDPAVLTLDEYPEVMITVTNVCAEAVLPVELVKFNAREKNGKVYLDWTTATEVNNDFFAVEKSVDGISFAEFYRMKGKQFSSTLLEYEAIDETPHKGINYYRLRQVDMDGAVTFSGIRSVQVGETKRSGLRAIPNLVSQGQEFRLDLSGFDEGTFEVMLVDLLGKRTALGTATGGEGVRFTAPSLPAGQYLVSITGIGVSETCRIFLR